MPLGQDCGQPTGAFSQPLVAAEGVTEIVAADGGELCLGLQHRRVELAESLAQGRLGVSVRRSIRDDPCHALLEGVELAPGEEDAQAAQLADEGAVAPGGVGLSLERTQLPPHLAEQVLEPGEVRLGRGEPPFGLLLALAELEDTCGLLDDQPAFLGPGVENRVDLSLTDDDVLLSADPRVRQQVGDVEQATRNPVDRVLAVAGSEQRAADGDLGEVDREQPRRVVDGQRHLGSAQRLTFGRTGEDDIVHLLTADGLGRLCTEHPPDGIDHVRLAGSVGSDHDRDARFELERGGLCEGLETLEGQRLQEHCGPP